MEPKYLNKVIRHKGGRAMYGVECGHVYGVHYYQGDVLKERGERKRRGVCV